MGKLTPKQELFVAAYVAEPNATKAAKTAGYSEKTAYSQGQRLLKKVEVQQAVAEGQSALAERAEITKDWLIEKSRNVFELAMGLNTDALDRYGKPTGEQRRQLSAANKAIENIGKLTGHWIDRKDVTMHQIDQMSLEELEDDLAKTRRQIAEIEAAGGI